MNEHEALPAGGPAKFTQNAVKIYVISSRERLLLPLAFCFCLLLVNTLLWSGPTAGLTASVCVWYGLLGLYLGRTLLNTWESRVLLAVNLALAATLALGSNWYFRAWNLLALLALLASVGTPAAPGAGAVILFTILSGAGFVNDSALLAYSLILAINRPIEMLVTSLNVVGDAVASICVAKSEGMLDEEKYNA